MASNSYGDLDIRIAIERAVADRNALNEKILTWSTFRTVWANRRDVSGSEGYRAREVGAEITTRFRVRWSASMATVTPSDRVQYDGRVYEITAVRDVERREWREIDTVARSDAAPVVVDASP